MAIDISLVLFIFTLSSIPFLIIAIATVQTVIYKNRILRGDISHASELPYLVRMHGITVRKLSTSIFTNAIVVSIFFGFPILSVGVLWPEELGSFIADLQFWIILWFVLAFIRIMFYSPDSTGGLGNAYELLDVDENREHDT